MYEVLIDELSNLFSEVSVDIYGPVSGKKNKPLAFFQAIAWPPLCVAYNV